ncbi:integrase core domain-containing protein [Corynebacterium pseudodiphtheriticum]|uniref:integrase core domain-containing protein n=1 Tax=Corynebacterium pseudodiphtheriticum TaxID=37637 RepID=UPI003D7058AF
MKRSSHRACPGITGLWTPSTNRLRDELLEDEMFDAPAHASGCLRLWSQRCNTHHPHSSLGLIPPTEYANQWHQPREGTQTAWPNRP